MKYQQEYKELITKDMAAATEDAANLRVYIEESSAHYHGYTVHTLLIPKMYTEKDFSALAETAEKTHRILCKVTDRYISDPEYRKLFGFDERLEELILHKPLYEQRLPIARIDVFYNPENGDFKFCEFNTDGSSGMNEDRELNRSLDRTKLFSQFKSNHTIRRFELFDSWVKDFLGIYKTTPGAKEKPNVAIVDFMTSASNEEFEEFKRAFERAGVSCEICDIFKLRRENNSLISPDGNVIDAVYRRAVTSDVMKNYDEVKPFIDSFLNDETVVIGDFRTQLGHNKLIFKILRDDMTKSFLTDEENEFIAAHIPETYMLTHDNIHKFNVIEDRFNWIVKPTDSYASKGVLAGIEAKDAEEWLSFLSKHMDTDYLLQRYITPYETENIDLVWDKNAQFRGFANITGLFTYCGKLQGIYSRIAKSGVISTQYSEMTLPTMIVSD